MAPSTTSRSGSTATPAAPSRSSPWPGAMPQTPSSPSTPPRQPSCSRGSRRTFGAGLFERKGHTTVALFSVILPLLVLSVAGVVLSERASVNALSGALMGLAWIQSGWIGHESGHYSVMRSPGVNRVVQILWGNVLAGINIGWWKWNHNGHHISCNSLDFDPDLQYLPFFVVLSSFFSSLTSRFYDRKLPFGAVVCAANGNINAGDSKISQLGYNGVPMPYNGDTKEAKMDGTSTSTAAQYTDDKSTIGHEDNKNIQDEYIKAYYAASLKQQQELEEAAKTQLSNTPPADDPSSSTSNRQVGMKSKREEDDDGTEWEEAPFTDT
ncbi:hypothetical protein Fmac_020492 [Flemingia macrophylla]|uniref:Fatty acid desaturase domain-containing protein n=1 Tax=Flemingia macrophylla TaxID=520843 RepID=A0ABD1LVZ8_9FABA